MPTTPKAVTKRAQRAAQAVIPTRKYAKPWENEPPGAKARNAILAATRRLGTRIWTKWSGYHRRSLVETRMRCFKLPGERVMARDVDRRVAELQARAVILNRFTRVGAPTTVAVTMPSLRLGVGELRPRLIYATTPHGRQRCAALLCSNDLRSIKERNPPHRIRMRRIGLMHGITRTVYRCDLSL